MRYVACALFACLSVLSEAAWAGEFHCSPYTGECYRYTGQGPFANFLLHVYDGTFTEANGYTFAFKLPNNFAGFTGVTTASLTPPPIVPDPINFPLTWCEMTGTDGAVMYSSGYLSAEQLLLNVACTCLNIGNCSENVFCRPEDPNQPTMIDNQISAPMCG